MALVINQVNFLNWTPGWFLCVYGVCLFAFWIFSIFTRRRLMRNFQVNTVSESEEIPPREAAVLAGGLPRLAQLSVVQLIYCHAVSYSKEGYATGGKLHFVERPREVLSAAANAVMEEVHTAGESGLPIQKVVSIVRPLMTPVDVSLAKRGLKPTPKEWNDICFWSVAPLIALMVVGVIRAVNGLAHQRPIGYLFTLLIVTAASLLLSYLLATRLTPDGKKTLKAMRKDNKKKTFATEGDFILGFAVLGTVALSSAESFDSIRLSLAKELDAFTYVGGTGDGGSGSGCSDGGGCGGGGCGGCGGCGG